jgi:acylglycerol lipase
MPENNFSSSPIPQLRLSDPASAQSGIDSDLFAYLQSYGLPFPPSVRYGNLRFDSRQPKHRVQLFGQAWLPQHPRGVVFFVHGFGEHTANYAQLINDLVNSRFAVAAMDLRGHGLSQGPRGHTESPNAYVEDLELWASIAYPKLAPSTPIFLWGHSLGGQICLQAIARNKFPRRVSAATLSSPFLDFHAFTGMRGLLLKLTPIFARLAPALPFSSGLGDDDRSSNHAYNERRARDPLIHHSVTALWAKSVSAAMSELRQSAELFRDLAPTLMLLAGDERIANLLSSRNFAFKAFTNLRHKVIEYPGMRHELEKEPVRESLVSETLAWFNSNCG